jgi:hypothetical protein
MILDHVITPQVAAALGIGKSYDDLRALYDRWGVMFQRNPSLLQTDQVTATMAELRRQMSLLSAELRVALADERDTGDNYARAADFMARPSLKRLSRQSYIDLLGNSERITDNLQTDGLAAAVELLGLTSRVTKIEQLRNKAEDLIAERGEELEFQKQLGSASSIRRLVEKQLRLILYSILPVLHITSQNPETTQLIDNVALNINGLLDSCRHLIHSPASSKGDGGESTQ